MTIKKIGDRRSYIERRKVQIPISFPDRRTIDRRESLAKKKKKIVILGLKKVKKNEELESQMNKMLKEKDMDGRVHVESSADLMDFVRYGVVLAPGVIIDGKLKSAGKNPSKNDIKAWLSELHKNLSSVSSSIDDMSDEDFLNKFGEE
jgi:hypothetical protein